MARGIPTSSWYGLGYAKRNQVITMEPPSQGYQKDTDVDGLREEQIYWNMNDGEYFLVIEDRGDEVTIATLHDGSIEIYEKEGMIFNDECVWSAIIPVEHKTYEH
jgi:hypothetical protein